MEDPGEDHLSRALYRQADEVVRLSFFSDLMWTSKKELINFTSIMR
jgi:hypothetical protein